MGLRSIKRGMITSADITASKFHCKEFSFSLFCVTASGTLHSTFFYIIGENRTAQFSFTIIAISKAQLKATANVTNRKTMKFFSLAWTTFPFQSTRHKQALGNAPEKFRDNFSFSARGSFWGFKRTLVFRCFLGNMRTFTAASKCFVKFRNKNLENSNFLFNIFLEH